jgi:hypothetical protein
VAATVCTTPTPDPDPEDDFMLTVCGCPLSTEETTALVERLEDDPTVVSHEAAAAIRYAAESGAPTTNLEPDLQDAIRHALVHGPLPLGLGALRDALNGGDC